MQQTQTLQYLLQHMGKNGRNWAFAVSFLYATQKTCIVLSQLGAEEIFLYELCFFTGSLIGKTNVFKKGERNVAVRTHKCSIY
jgi:hypothetical protein